MRTNKDLRPGTGRKGGKEEEEEAIRSVGHRKIIRNDRARNARRMDNELRGIARRGLAAHSRGRR